MDQVSRYTSCPQLPSYPRSYLVHCTDHLCLTLLQPSCLDSFFRGGTFMKRTSLSTGCKTRLREKSWTLDHFSFQTQPDLPQSICTFLNRLEKDLLNLSDPLDPQSLIIPIPIWFFRKRHRETTTRESSDSSDADVDMGQDLSVGPFEHEHVEIGPGVLLGIKLTGWYFVGKTENQFQPSHVIIHFFLFADFFQNCTSLGILSKPCYSYETLNRRSYKDGKGWIFGRGGQIVEANLLPWNGQRWSS